MKNYFESFIDDGCTVLRVVVNNKAVYDNIANSNHKFSINGVHDYDLHEVIDWFEAKYGVELLSLEELKLIHEEW